MPVRLEPRGSGGHLAALLAFSVCGVAVFVLVVAGIAMARRGSYVLLLRRSIVYVVGRVSVRPSVCLCGRSTAARRADGLLLSTGAGSRSRLIAAGAALATVSRSISAADAGAQ